MERWTIPGDEEKENEKGGEEEEEEETEMEGDKINFHVPSLTDCLRLTSTETFL